ncbi:TetR/AcrR family transcriptional regulator [Variovorax sp. H27-G14]|uniref:TetR family transcriptional regulator n=1 Tax=Variovorax sp. H27-G14 TaxID=3111914 RepID=UPI0038FC9AFA
MSTRTPAARRSASRTPTPPPAAVATETARPDRKQAILLAAEKLFARHGYHVVTIRQIAEEAGVPLALVGYYYGAKHELFHAIFAHWGHSIEARLAGLAAVTIDPDDARTLPRIIDAFTAPVLALRASAEGEYYALLVARELYHATEEADRVLRAYFDPLAEAYIDALHVALPHATRSQAAWGYQFALGALLHHLNDSRIERLSRGENKRADPAVAPMLVNFIVGGLRAALPRPKSGNSTNGTKSTKTPPTKTTPRRQKT